MQTYDFDLGLERKAKQITSNGDTALLVCSNGNGMTQQTKVHPEEMKNFKNLFQKTCEYLKLRAAAKKELRIKDAMACSCTISKWEGSYEP